jgi:hypothetical protein
MQNITEHQLVMITAVALIPAAMAFTYFIIYILYLFVKNMPILFSLVMHVPIAIIFMFAMNYARITLGSEWLSTLDHSSAIFGTCAFFSFYGHLVVLCHNDKCQEDADEEDRDDNQTTPEGENR